MILKFERFCNETYKVNIKLYKGIKYYEQVYNNPFGWSISNKIYDCDVKCAIFELDKNLYNDKKYLKILNNYKRDIYKIEETNNSYKYIIDYNRLYEVLFDLSKGKILKVKYNKLKPNFIENIFPIYIDPINIYQVVYDILISLLQILIINILNIVIFIFRKDIYKKDLINYVIYDDFLINKYILDKINIKYNKKMCLEYIQKDFFNKYIVNDGYNNFEIINNFKFSRYINYGYMLKKIDKKSK